MRPLILFPANEDYVEPSVITLTFSPGEMQKSFTVMTVNDDTNELDESFGAVLENQNNAMIGLARLATVNIRDEDSKHQFQRNDGIAL